ncbi:hypothetical protein NN561_015471 [Cricetulus griseus]
MIRLSRRSLGHLMPINEARNRVSGRCQQLCLERWRAPVFLPGSRVPGGCPTRVLRASPSLSDRPVRPTEPLRLAARLSETATVLSVAREPEPPFSALPGFWVQAQLRFLRAGGERGALGGSRLGPRLRSRVRARSARGQLWPRVTCRLRAAAVAPARATALGIGWSASASCAPLCAPAL